MARTKNLNRLAARIAAGDTIPESEQRRMIGWAGCMFYDARIPILAGRLSETNRAKLEAMPYWKQCEVIQKLVLRGAMI